MITKREFMQAYDEHADSIFRHCFLRIEDRERSKKVMCDAFKQLWLFIARGNFVDSIKIFLYREANALLHQQQLEKKTSQAARADAASALSQLPPEHRNVFLLHFVDGFSCKEICEILGGSHETHAQNLQAIRNQFSSLSSYVA